ncbi:MAG: DUF4835 family protein [Muribaculaceae bacterium]|nr:DUF4835 family protein [Muribaculaceae bacterium]MDE6315558.1 DUF4835 family protein [Muribaculaceae bacterium]
MKTRLFIAVAALMTAGFCASAQELNCRVEFNTQQLQNVGTSVFQTLQEAVSEYMNNTKFSEAQIASSEKIECQLVFTITDYTDGVAKGSIQVQSIRPVYNTAYTTTLLNFKDNKIDFSYSEGEPLQFSENTMESQLTALLNFYAYLILAMDFDSFSLRGGEVFWQRLATIVQQAQSSGEIGWKAFEDNKNRSAVLSAYTDPATRELRDLTYQYHRAGLDEMAQSPDKGRANITSALEILKKVYDVSSMSVGLSMTKDAKLDELVNVYSKAPQTEREKVYEILYPLFPTETTRLDKIKKGQTK